MMRTRLNGFFGILSIMAMVIGAPALTHAYGVSGVLSAGKDHTCAVRDDGSIVCWGANGENQSEAPDGKFVQVRAPVMNTPVHWKQTARFFAGAAGRMSLIVRWRETLFRSMPADTADTAKIWFAV